MLHGLILLMTILSWEPLQAAITLDASSQSADNENASSVTWSHTVGSGSNRYLYVCVQARGTTKSNLTITSVTFGGVGLTNVRSDARDSAPAYYRTELWRLKAPTTSSANIVVTATGTAEDYLVGSALSLNGVDQSSPENTSGGGGGTGATISTVITTTTDAAWILDCAMGSDNGGLTLGSGQTEHSRRTVGVSLGTIDGVGMSSVQGKSPAGNETMDWSQATSTNWVISAVALTPSTTGITLDTVSQSADNENASSVTWSHTVGSGSNRYLYVCVQARGTTKSNLTITSVTFNGTALTQIRADARDASPAFYRTELWRLIAPANTTANIVVTAAGAAEDYLVGSAVSLNGVNQTTPEHAQNGGNGSGTTISTTVTTTTDQAWVLDCAIGGDNAGLTIGAGQTQHSKRIVGISLGTYDGVGTSSVQGKTPAGAEVMDWSQAATNNWVISAVALLPASVTVAPVIAYVQSCAMAKANYAPSISCTLPNLPAIGNTVIIMMSFRQLGLGGSTSCQRAVDSLGNIFALAVESPVSGLVRSYIWSSPILYPSGGSYSVTVTCPSSSWMTMQAMEIAGLVKSTSSLDAVGWTGLIGASSSIVSTFMPMQQPNELAVAVLSLDKPIAVTIDEDMSWTKRYEQEDCDTASTGSICGSGLMRIYSSAVAPSHTWVLSANADSSAAIATFRAVQSSTGTITRTLTWTNNATNATSITVQKRTDQTAPNWVDVAAGLPASTQTYVATISTLETGDCWRVIAVNSAGIGVSNVACGDASSSTPIPLSPLVPAVDIGSLQPLLDDELL